MDTDGFTAEDWARKPTFGGRCAAPADVEAGRAVFALGDTINGRPMAMAMPQPVIWYEEGEQFAALIVQAEVHETEDGDTLQVLGLLLSMGRTAVGFMEDIEEVEATDPVWLSLIEADSEGGDGWDEQGEY